MAIDRKSTLRSVFAVWNNPEHDYTYKHSEDGIILRDALGKPIILYDKPTLLTGLTPSQICEKVVTMWTETKPGRTAACIYCISADGLHHLHIVLECGRGDTFRYSAVQDLYAQKMHLEPTRGNKQQAEDYINKQGKWEEKGEIIVAKYQHGEIKAAQGNRSDIDAIELMIAEGKTPAEIMRERFAYRRYDKMIRDAYFDKRKSETPFYRNINVVWHYGETGSGKSFTAKKLVDDYGEENVFVMSDFDNGGLDHYCGERILFLDEFRGQWKYSTLLTALDGYKTEMHARNTNTLPLWSEVHITSPFTPDEVYKKMRIDDEHKDSIKQLLRRISSVVHHWKTDEGYFEYSVPGDKIKDCIFGIRQHVETLKMLSDSTLPY